MTPLEKCLQPLKILIAVGDINGIAAAERAIDEFVAAHDGPNHQTIALNTLEDKLSSHLDGVTGSSADFGKVVFGYIDNRVLALQETP